MAVNELIEGGYITGNCIDKYPYIAMELEYNDFLSDAWVFVDIPDYI